MLKGKSKILLSLFVILVLISTISFATVEPRTDEISNTTVENTENNDESSSNSDWTNSDLYISQDNVNITNVVDGNAFIIGNEVTISGEIGGDLFVLANKLTIEGGYVYSSIFACANEIIVNGVVYDIYANCNSFTLENDGFVYRDMKVSSNRVNINGKVRRNAFINSANINIASESGTLIYGNLNYNSNSEITVPENSIQGEVNYNKANVNTNLKSVGSIVLSYVLSLLEVLLYTFVVTMLVLWLAPKFLDRVSKMGVAKSFISLGIGAASVIAIAIASFLLIISIIGVPIFFTTMLVYILISCIAFSIASIFFGKLFTKILKMEGKVKFVLFTLLSAIVLWGLTKIPFVGWLISLLITLFGIGTTIVNIVYKKEKIETVEK